MTAPPIDWHDICTNASDYDDYQPGDHAPTPFDLRQHEMRDLRDQGVGRVALWTADTVPTGRYL
ncbi:hypothetical protein SGFS_013350 [Streptomyces graminofaciens]|uniref:Uncharacterized protein n=1 Tax=Streptomyces graminofaciens TaxID=68212 RepID=A0ABN5V9X6_9ACTN|nr:hypothetical protein [Streptomyces graminofaciens]BBC30041.1 hypothetical protein SGFS_013350 [Streptomyces graminofaciens]